ncbi:site-specific DNA-methyltransferase [Campylobacter showae]|uniref:site-specific DNA-methyltransferase n=1 Tax=Campylobacter showae TaxID=204 RepID=UPI0026F28A74|nr:site-specific DNA-methyltransferase [Campylobacter showae]
MDKMRMETADIAAQNIEKIGALFPNCITEMLDEEKSTAENKVYKKAINFELLKQMLSKEAIDGNEAYEFTWVGKKASIIEANKPIRKTLRPCKDESTNWDKTQNLYIEGDNLEVLKLLQESYLGKVKMIYIDPPYNTGNDFIYNDDFKMSSDEYASESGEIDEAGNRMFKNTDSNGRFHSDWCSMIYPRLMLARNLLSDDGVIFISIDDNEQANLKKICDEVFGEKNYCGTIPYRKRTMKTDVPFGISQDYEWVTVYAKSDSFFAGVPVERKYYSSIDYPNDRWRLSDLTTQKIESQRPNSAFDLIDPKTGKVYKYNPKRLWAITKDTFRNYYDRGKIVFPDDYDFLSISIPAYRVFESEDKQKSLRMYGTETPLKSFSTVLSNEVGMNEQGSKEVDDLVGNKVFSFPKPSTLVKQFLISLHDKDAIILDFFSGSATTAHAVMAQNLEDGGNRKFIMVQLPEKTDEDSEAYKAGYKNICEIGKERIRRAGKKILEENKDKEGIENLDTGFRVLKLDDTNMRDIYYSPSEYSQDLLFKLDSNVKSDRTDLDLLFGCLLEWGLPLSLPYTCENIEDCTVHNYNDGDLIACFDENIAENVIKEIAKKRPLRAVFRDSSFADSPSKINVSEIFKLLAPDTRVKVI